MATIQNEKARIETLKHQAEVAEREGDYGKVAEIRYSQIPAAEANIKSAQDSLHAISNEALIKEEVDEDDIAEVVARWTGIPVAKMMQSERDKDDAKLKVIEEQLSELKAKSEELNKRWNQEKG